MTCSYAKCDKESAIERRYTGDDEVYSYCPKHDPLDDKRAVSEVFEEV